MAVGNDVAVGMKRGRKDQKHKRNEGNAKFLPNKLIFKTQLAVQIFLHDAPNSLQSLENPLKKRKKERKNANFR